ncbi:MAG: hypothetical protein OEV44_01415 [Spirochaetota bacterium]|nr:hypothetical protein [Spirochaetota bacterium]
MKSLNRFKMDYHKSKNIRHLILKPFLMFLISIFIFIVALFLYGKKPFDSNIFKKYNKGQMGHLIYAKMDDNLLNDCGKEKYVYLFYKEIMENNEIVIRVKKIKLVKFTQSINSNVQKLQNNKEIIFDIKKKLNLVVQ